jgi:hypothetical protein
MLLTLTENTAKKANMIEHAQDIVSMQWWLILFVGGGLLALMVYIGQRWDKKIEEMPERISKQVEKVHDEIVAQMRVMNDTHFRLEKDVRNQITEIDRRVVRLETRCDFHHSNMQ